jgi:hypothetical protein
MRARLIDGKIVEGRPAPTPLVQRAGKQADLQTSLGGRPFTFLRASRRFFDRDQCVEAALMNSILH